MILLEEDLRIERRIERVRSALWFAEQKLPQAVRGETGMAVYDVIKGIIPGLLLALAVVGATTLFGIGIGAFFGFFSGAGLGALPGAVSGGMLGFESGVWLLNWIGIGFLITYMGTSLWEGLINIKRGLSSAWGPKDKWNAGFDDCNVIIAGDHIARGVAIVFRSILEAIVIYLTTRGVAKLPELVSQLKSSRLGEGFAVWVEQNYQELLKNPRLNRRAGGVAGLAAEKPVKVLDHTNVPEQPRPAELPNLRRKYVKEVEGLKNDLADMREKGYSEEYIARTLNEKRRAIGEKYKDITPPELRERIYQRNLRIYGDKLGPTIDFLLDEGKSWEQISEGACRAGGKDLGF